MPSETKNIVITPEQLAMAERLGSIFMPYAMKQRKAFFEKEPNQTHARLIHYTTAESALKIIRSKRFWMRNTNCMSDYSEVQHGFNIFHQFFSNQTKKKAFTDALDACAPEVAFEAIQLFDNLTKHILLNTFISSVSEHREEEDQHGRLSMWRAFGGSTARVGIVFKIPLISQGSLALGLVFSAVAYLGETQAHTVLQEVIQQIRSNCEYLRTIERGALVRTVFMMLLAGVACLKHEGFQEEREWRAIYAPGCWASTLMEHSTEVINGIPQIVYKIPLDATVSELVADLEFSKLFDRLIIGPSSYPWPMRDAFVAELEKSGVGDAERRVVLSGIPIRS